MVYCDYVNCKNKKSYGVARFLLPNDNRRDIWLLNSGNSYSSKLISNEPIYICSDHFDQKFLNRGSVRARLSMSAIPDLHFESEINSKNVQNKENEPNVKHFKQNKVQNESVDNRKVLSEVLSVKIMDSAKSSTTMPSATITNIELVGFNEEYVGCSRAPLTPYSNVFRDFKGTEDTEICQTQFPSPSYRREYEIQIDPHEADQSKIPIDELLKSPKKKIFKPEAARKLLSSRVVEEMLEKKTKSVGTFVKSQLLHTKNTKWSTDEKELFLKFHYKSPSFYKYLQKEGFVLPSLRTIIRWYDLMSFDAGISYDILHMLKHKLSEMPDINKKCLLVFDEMSVKNELEYNSREDKVYGFEDLGEFGRVRCLANHALLFMLRGLNKSWKQIIGYYCGNVNGVTLAEIIQSTIKILIQEGIEVVAIVCDQGAANRTAQNRLGVTTEKPFFEIMERTIFCFYDFVHLIKSVRNNLLVSNIFIDDDVISWSVLNKLFYAENGVVRSMHKLTEAHIKPDNFQKMRVKLATQVFSHHVSTAIFAAASTNIFNEEEKLVALSTASFIFKLNKLFDNMNSTNRYSKNPDKCALSIDQTDVSTNLKESLEWIGKWKREKKGYVYCFSGLLQSINATLQLWDDIKEEKQQYLITSHLNSDCLENTISVLRNNRGSYEKNPSVFRLHKNLKQMCFYNIMAPDTTSYEISESSVILNMSDVENFLNPDGTDPSYNDESLNAQEAIPKKLMPVLISNVNIAENYNRDCGAEEVDDANKCEFDDSDAEDTADNENETDASLNDMATTYFAGYVAHAVLKIHNCRGCKYFMCKENEDKNYQKSENLIKNRQYENTNNGGLLVPTEPFVDIIQIIINCFETNFEKFCFERNVIKQLFDLCGNQIKIPCVILEHKNYLIMHTMRVLIRAKLKILNASAKNKKRKLRKFDILNHI